MNLVIQLGKLFFFSLKNFFHLSTLSRISRQQLYNCTIVAQVVQVQGNKDFKHQREFVRPLCFSKCIPLHFRAISMSWLGGRDSWQQISDCGVSDTSLRIWRGETTSSCSRLARKLARRSNDLPDEVRVKATKRGIGNGSVSSASPRFGSHSGDATLRYRETSQLLHRRVAIFKNFPFHPLVSIVEKFGRRRHFESRAIGIHGCAPASSISRATFSEKSDREDEHFSRYRPMLADILVHITDFSNQWSNFTNFIDYFNKRNIQI